MRTHTEVAEAALRLLAFQRYSKLSYLCHCLATINDRAARTLISEIERRLFPHVSVDGWLNARGLVRTQDFSDAADTEVQQYRKRWLLALARELDNEVINEIQTFGTIGKS